MDGKTFQELNRRPPFPRRYHARVIRQLTKAGAKVIAYDVQFTEPTDTADDNALILAVRAHPHMVMATTNVFENGTTRVFGGAEGLAFSRATAGDSNYVNDSDGRIRHLAFKLEGIETFPVVAARAFRADRAHRLGKVDLPSGNSAWIDYKELDAERPPAQLHRRLSRQVRSGGRPRQDRGRRRHHAPRPGPAPDLGQRRRAHARPRDPGQRDQHGPRELPDHGRAAVARHAAAPGARAPHAARRTATADLPGARHRRARRWPASSSPPRSPSTTARC